jgi:DNA-binding NarL/FixJ family response regulator
MTVNEITPDLERGSLRVLVVDRNMVMRQGLRSLLEADVRVGAVYETDGSDAVESVERLRPDVVLFTTLWPDVDDQGLLDQLCRRAAVLVLSDSAERALVERGLRAGATGFLVHGQFLAEDLAGAVLATAGRQPTLSPGAVTALVESVRSASSPRIEAAAGSAPAYGLSRREVEIMECVVWGHGNLDIARTLCISEKTVKNHINHIYMKLGCRNRAEAISLWLGTARPTAPRTVVPQARSRV